MTVSDDDERLHPVEHPSEHWSDSLYFNAWDPATGTFLMTRMAVLGNAKTASSGLVVWLDGVPAYGYGHQLDELPPTDWDVMAIGGLAYRMLAANQRWGISLDDGDNRAWLEWDGFSGAYDYADNVVPFNRAWAWGHYEQSCRVRGDLHVGGRTIAFDGFGQRDHSWGFRDWGGLQEWHWVTGFFGDDLAFNLMHIVAPDGTATVNGFVHRGGEDLGVVSAQRRTAENGDRSPQSYDMALTLDDGSTVDIAGEAAAAEVPVRPSAGETVVHEVPMRLRCGEREGFGIYELLENSRS